jgi:AFG3 family protein
MNDVVGPVSYGGMEGAKEGFTKPFSEKTGEAVDAEVRKMITYVGLAAELFPS